MGIFLITARYFSSSLFILLFFISLVTTSHKRRGQKKKIERKEKRDERVERARDMMIASSSSGARTKPPLSFSKSFQKRKTNWKSSRRRRSASSSSSSSSTTSEETNAVLLNARVQENNISKKKKSPSLLFEVFGSDLSSSAQYPDVPRERTHWVETDEQLNVLVEEIRAALMKKEEEKKDDDDDGTECEKNSYRRQRLPVVLGLDCEWKPGDNTPVSLFQVATRENVYLLDVFAFMMDTGGGGEEKGTAEAFDAFLKLLFENETLIKLGFGFDYDIKRLRMSYASLEETLSMDRRKKGWIDVRELAYTADAVSSHNKRKYKHQKRVGLAALTRDILKCNLDKKCQVSDWSQRPLSDPQQRYAATDAYSLISILDVVLFSRGRWNNDEEISDGLQLVQYGGGGNGEAGGIDGRFVKRVSKSKMAKMEKAAFLKRQNSSSLRNARETALHEAKADLTRCVTDYLGFACVGRKGAIELLSENGCSVRMPKKTKSKVDNWENAVALFLTVDEPKKTQPAQFRRREDDNFLTLRLENAEKFFSEDAEAYARTKACKANDGGKSIVLFAKRGSKGKFVFCGRLESNSSGSISGSSNSVIANSSDALDLTLVDGDRLSETPMFYQIIGCHL